MWWVALACCAPLPLPRSLPNAACLPKVALACSRLLLGRLLPPALPSGTAEHRTLPPRRPPAPLLLFVLLVTTRRAPLGCVAARKGRQRNMAAGASAGLARDLQAAGGLEVLLCC